MPEVQAPAYDCAIRKNVPCLDCAAVRGEDGSLNLFLVNRAEEPMDLSVEASAARAELTTLRGSELVRTDCGLTPNTVETQLPPRSWNMLRVL